MIRTPIEILAGLAILANAVIYGTHVFGAICQLRPVRTVWVAATALQAGAGTLQ